MTDKLNWFDKVVLSIWFITLIPILILTVILFDIPRFFIDGPTGTKET